MKNKKWYSIKAEADRADIYIFGEVGMWGVSAQDFISSMNEHKGKALNIHINSEGGSVFDGQAIHSALKSHDAHVKVSVEGLAASIATVIALGGDEVEMTNNSLWMIHSPMVGAHGNKAELKKQIDLLDRVEETMLNVYTSKSNLDSKELSEMMENETWMNADEALEAGFIDSITDEVKVAANFDASKFKMKTENEILNVLNGLESNQVTNDNMNEESRNWFVAQFDKLASKLTGQADVEPTPEPVTVEPAVVEPVLEPTADPAQTNLEAQIAELTSERDALLEQAQVVSEEQVDYGAEMAAMKGRISELEATPSTVLSTQEPNVVTSPATEKSDWDKMADAIFD